MIYCKELKKEFATKNEMLAELVANKQLIIDSKKSAVKFSDCVRLNTTKETTKAESLPTNLLYPIINTTNYMDSHGDVHAKGIWSKSITEQVGKLYYVLDHDLDIDAVISYPKNVNPMVIDMPWSDLGVDYKGTTEALTYEITLTGSEPKSFQRALVEGNLQNSVRMQYINILLCVNDSEYEQERANWNKYRKEIVNGDLADEVGYFWYVTEAKIVKEGSAVLFGSNDQTPILTSIDKQEPTKVTPTINNGVTKRILNLI